MDIGFWADKMALAHQSGLPKPNINESCSLADAYLIQQRLLSLLNAEVVGYKSALTNASAQRAFKINEPVLGALLGSEDKNSSIHLGDYAAPVIETELGYKLTKDVSKPISISQLGEYFGEPLVMIEIAQVGYEDRMTLTDLVAGNSASGTFIEGGPIDVPDVNAIEVELTQNERVIHTAKASDIGDQRAVLVWLTNKALTLGYPVKQGMIMMTGSLGKILPAHPGAYVARYKAAGETRDLAFTLVN